MVKQLNYVWLTAEIRTVYDKTLEGENLRGFRTANVFQ